MCTPTIPEVFSPDKSDYTFYSLTFEKNGFYGKYAGFAQDLRRRLFRSWLRHDRLAEIDLGIALIVNSDD